jgi:hypothetical protein
MSANLSHGDAAARPLEVTRSFETYPLLEALIHRRSRRFGMGMQLNEGPLAYHSAEAAQPLNVEEEAALAFAACGVTGYALAELPYQSGDLPEDGEGKIMVNFLGRTVASGHALYYVAVFVINDEGAWMLKRPQDYPGPISLNWSRRHGNTGWRSCTKGRGFGSRLGDRMCRARSLSSPPSTIGPPMFPAPPTSCP